MKKTLIAVAILALGFLSKAEAFGPSIFNALGRTPAQRGDCTEARVGKTYVTLSVTAGSCTDAGTASTVCQCNATGDEENPYAWQALLTSATLTPTPDASTTVKGIVELALSTESTAGLAVQSNDYRIAPKTRTVIVDANKTAVAGAVYNTVSDAMTYVATQSPEDSNPWRVEVYGASFTEAGPFTIPDGVHLKCNNAGAIYLGGDATNINTGMTSGVFVTMAGGSITNCIIQQNGTADAAMTALKITGNASLDHVGVVQNGGATSVADVIVLDVTPPSGFITAQLYYVVLTQATDNTNGVGLNLGTGGFIQYDNGLISAAGGAGSNGKGIRILAASPAYMTVKNVMIGSAYMAGWVSDWVLDISNESTGTIYIGQSRYGLTSGTITVTDSGIPCGLPVASAPGTCDATHRVGSCYLDTTGPDKCTCWGASGWLPDDGSGTCA